MVYSIIQKSQLEGALRLDAEYYQPEYLEYSKKLINFPTIGELVEKILHPKEITRVYSHEGILYLLAQNVRSDYIDWSGKARMPFKTRDLIKQNLLKDSDVVIVRSGVNYGDTACFEKLEEDVFASADVLVVRPNKINGRYLATFLNTQIGKSLLKRLGYGAAQPHIAPSSIKDLHVPIVSKRDEEEIIKIISDSKNFEKQSELFYSQAENLLLEELGLSSFAKATADEKDLFSIVNLFDVKTANRIDAEYFQPKYDKLISKIKKQNSKLLGEIVSIKKGIETGAEEYQDEGKLFIRVSSLTKQGIIDKDQKYLSDELYQKLKKDFEPRVGEILLTKDATPGVAYAIKEPVEGIISGGILRLKLKEGVDAEYVALCINSIIGQMQAGRDAGGSIIAHWRPEQIENLVIPILPKPIQQKIADLIRTSHSARKKAKELLEEAKRKVEEMIEK
jgi:restriction endonuclease S subunit